MRKTMLFGRTNYVDPNDPDPIDDGTKEGPGDEVNEGAPDDDDPEEEE